MIKFILNYENDISVDLINDSDDLIIDTLVAMRDTHSKFKSIDAGHIPLPLNNDYFQMFYLEAINFPEVFFLELMHFVEFLRQYTASIEQLAILAMALKVMRDLPYSLYTIEGLTESLELIIQRIPQMYTTTYDPATDTLYEIGKRIVNAVPSIRQFPRIYFFLDKTQVPEKYAGSPSRIQFSDEELKVLVDYKRIGAFIIQLADEESTQYVVSTKYFINVVPIKLATGKETNLVVISPDGLIV